MTRPREMNPRQLRRHYKRRIALKLGQGWRADITNIPLKNTTIWKEVAHLTKSGTPLATSVEWLADTRVFNQAQHRNTRSDMTIEDVRDVKRRWVAHQEALNASAVDDEENEELGATGEDDSDEDK